MLFKPIQTLGDLLLELFPLVRRGDIPILFLLLASPAAHQRRHPLWHEAALPPQLVKATQARFKAYAPQHLSLFETHHASIVFANGGGAAPPPPPPHNPLPPPRFLKACKLVYDPQSMSLFETHHANTVFANGAALPPQPPRSPPKPPLCFKPCKACFKAYESS